MQQRLVRSALHAGFRSVCPQKPGDNLWQRLQYAWARLNSRVQFRERVNMTLHLDERISMRGAFIARTLKVAAEGTRR